MKFTVGVLTHNVIKHFRAELLQQTLESIFIAFDRLHDSTGFDETRIVLYDNGSDDETSELEFIDLNRIFLITSGDTINNTPGHGINTWIDMIDKDPESIIVCSDDDMFWHPDAKSKLESIWKAAPKELVLVGGFLEPMYEWNTPRERLELGGVPVLVLDSAPSCAWSFRARDWHLFWPLKEDFGQDVDACQRLRKAGYRIGQADLADHKGIEYSTWENQAYKQAKPLDRKFWNI